MPPLLSLVLAAAIQWWNLAGIQFRLSTGLFASWYRLGQDAAGMARPPGALAAETALLLVSGVIAIFLMLRLRSLWAGIFVVTLSAAAFEISWALFVTHHWLIDAATPSIGLIVMFLTGAVAHVVQARKWRTRLRIAFSDSLPRAMLEKFVRQPELLNLEGQTRNVTYLVCGVRNLTQLSEEYRGDPQGFTRLMTGVMSPLLAQARAHGGTIDRLTSDGFTAYWNAPLDDSDHARHACEAARDMDAIMARTNEDIGASRVSNGKTHTSLEIGVGLAIGDVIAGGLDHGGRCNYSVHGGVVGLAARLQSLSSHYGQPVIVSQETMRAAEHGFAFLEVDYVAATGEDAPVRLYAMLGNPVARASPKFRALSTFHEHIFHSLRGQQWNEARNLIAQCRKLSGASQPLYDLHLTRIHYFENNPPGPNWDGAFRPVLK